ncbi:MAG: xanthine dehydrogenase family protein subunit M [Candidatus Bipolaricaulota bacterium]|nr:xanthine dehydrogenase family protein subunit M [Candidatus Bipolaricaulota bacterium]
MRHYVKIKTIPELLSRIEEPGARILCGGTDLVVKMRSGTIDPQVLLDISDTQELRGIEEKDDRVTIGAATTVSEIIADPVIVGKLSLLQSVLRTLGSTQIRNCATLGGNLVNASPAADSAIPLLLYQAQVVVAGAQGDRQVPVEDFLLAPGKAALSSGEFVRSVSIPIPSATFTPFFHKVGRRKAMIIAIASLGALVSVKDGTIDEIRLAAGSVAPRPIRLHNLETELTGKAITQSLIEQTKTAAMKAVSPIDDVRASANYRREVIGELVARVLRDMAQG